MRKRSLYLEFSVAISGIAVLLVMVVLNLNMARERHSLEEQREDHINTIMDLLGIAAAECASLGHPQSISTVGRQALNQRNVKYFVFVDTEGKCAVALGKGKAGESLHDEITLRAMKSNAPRLRQSFVDKKNGARIMDISQPVVVGGRRVGTICLGYDATPYHAKLHLMNTQAAGMAFLTIVVALFLSFFLARRIMQPIRMLKRGLDSLLMGLDIEQLPVSGVHEIQQLTESFNAISAKWKEMYAQLSKAYEELKTLDEMKDKFVSLVSHELRTPLSSIMAYSEVLCEPEKLTDGERREFAGIINTESARLSRLINAVLDLTKMKGGRLVYDYSTANVNDAVEQAVRTCAGAVSSRKQQLVFNKDDSVKPCDIDFDRIVQVATNLLNNASKFTPEGGRIEVTTTAKEDGVLLTVKDNGVGIDESNLDKVFEEFTQVGDIDTHEVGSGLGLAICKRLIEDGHNGKIWAESAGLGHGSTFHVFIPYRDRKEGSDKAKS